VIMTQSINALNIANTGALNLGPGLGRFKKIFFWGGGGGAHIFFVFFYLN